MSDDKYIWNTLNIRGSCGSCADEVTHETFPDISATNFEKPDVSRTKQLQANRPRPIFTASMKLQAYACIHRLNGIGISFTVSKYVSIELYIAPAKERPRATIYSQVLN